MMNESVEQLSRLLYEQDPMGTCCRENECFDEYDLIAASVVELVDQGLTYEASLKGVLTESFSRDLADKVDYAVLETNLRQTSSNS
jgi:hypothetical protein